MYYLAYGSNLNLNEMSKRCRSSNAIGTYNLLNYRLVYKGESDDYAYLTIEKCEGSFVPLGIFEIDDKDIIYLDIYEGYPELYYKKYIDIELDNKMIKGLIYIMNSEYSYHEPSNYYKNICIKGYQDFNFDLSILDKALEDTINNKNKILR